MIRAVLFDMDDTLLDIDLGAFVAKYIAGESRILGSIARKSPLALGVPLSRSYLAISSGKRNDDLTNGRLFADTFARITSIPLDDPVIAEALSCYEREVLPGLNDGIIHARPRPGGIEAIETARSLGLTVALATNPSFTEECVRCRMGWAGVADVDFARVSHMGNSTRLKPDARYYEEFVAALGLTSAECLMVGNDASRDFPRPACGLATAYVGHGRPKRATWRGDMSELARALPGIVDRLG